MTSSPGTWRATPTGGRAGGGVAAPRDWKHV